MTDIISISGLRAVAIVGALPHEREIAQPLGIDLRLEVDLHDAGATDELGDTVHYGLVSERVVACVEESKDILLERLVARIADEVLAFDRVDAVEVTLTKLRPPIAADAETTAVTIRRTAARASAASATSHRAFLALGSNLGDREAYLRFAVRQLGEVVAMSQIYETAPVGGPDDQGPYLNMVIEVATSLDPFALLRRCQRIEAEAARQRLVRWGPRTLDVDIVAYDDIEITSDELTVPHPRFAERRFVLAPLADIAPERCPDGWEADLPPDEVRVFGTLSLDQPDLS
ncbi:MAG: 2-amino-4-hydroxy-6-hydroxymethyldihydropteridine diphosphokinase [Acidimicrobiales bacterium]